MADPLVHSARWPRLLFRRRHLGLAGAGGGPAGEPIIVVGCEGIAGRLHSRIYETWPGARWAGHDPARGVVADLPWGDCIVDVCTPTATHARVLIEAHERGARRFIVEKPAAGSAATWRAVLARLPDATVCTVHHYLWSTALWRGLDRAGVVERVTSHFDKDRADDDRRGRGAHDGRLAHALQVEAPHQFAIALDAWAGLEVAGARVRERGARGDDDDAPTSVEVDLTAPGAPAVSLATDLRSPHRRTMTLTGDRGVVDIEFAVRGLGAAVFEDRGRGRRLVWSGDDDALRGNLVDAVTVLRDGRPVPRRLSSAFAADVLAGIDDALAHVELPVALAGS